MYVDKKQKSLILCFYSPLGTEIMVKKFTHAKWLIPVSIAWSEWEYYHCPLSIAKLTPSISSGFPDNSLAPGYTPRLYIGPQLPLFDWHTVCHGMPKFLVLWPIHNLKKLWRLRINIIILVFMVVAGQLHYPMGNVRPFCFWCALQAFQIGWDRLPI